MTPTRKAGSDRPAKAAAVVGRCTARAATAAGWAPTEATAPGTGLAAAVITLLPRVGFISGEEFSSGVNIRTCIYVAGILGLAITVTQTGIGGVVGNALLLRWRHLGRRDLDSAIDLNRVAVDDLAIEALRQGNAQITLARSRRPDDRNERGRD